MTVAASAADREAARVAAESIRHALRDPTTAGEPQSIHLLRSPRRLSGWLKTWSNLPGLILHLNERSYSHSLLPGWQYSVREMQTEMLDDLDRLATTGERPTKATS